jgi:hypothetical protein
MRDIQDQSPAQRLKGFIERYEPAVGAAARSALATLRKRLPGATELVYDNYNALAIGFGPTERASDAIFSIAVYPRWVSLFFLQGATLSDPRKLLKGSGTRVRHIVLESTTLEKAAVRELMAQALRKARKPLDGGARRRIVIRAVSAKQRPRRHGA